ncbi:hypothetical protein B2J93_9391 [Marssonina coronariae]|uniref:Uncharacterized protein n=1 Tax=Diplocarpon coronariae TaxID=2795749 RepID=A0A218Z9S7_9HELO|nr:hypothetical protein B2J93_9391 [Marssonina coronariae]
MRLTSYLVAAILAYNAAAAPVQPRAGEIFNSSHLHVGIPRQFGSRTQPEERNDEQDPAFENKFLHVGVHQTLADFNNAIEKHHANIEQEQHDSNAAQENDLELGPIRFDVAPNGIAEPSTSSNPLHSSGDLPSSNYDDQELELLMSDIEKYEHGNTTEVSQHQNSLGGLETTSTGLPFDSHPNDLEEFPTITDTDSIRSDTITSRFRARDSLWKPGEIESYKEGAKIEIRDSILELEDKLRYLNRAGHLTAEEAVSQIETYSKVIASRIKRNYISDPPDYITMLMALRNYIFVDIELRGQSQEPVAPITTEQQVQQEMDFSELHAYYVVEGLKEKLLRFAQVNLLSSINSRRAIAQAREMIRIGTKLPSDEARRYGALINEIEKVAGYMRKKHLRELPVTGMPSNPVPAAFGFKHRDLSLIITTPVNNSAKARPHFSPRSISKKRHFVYQE